MKGELKSTTAYKFICFNTSTIKQIQARSMITQEQIRVYERMIAKSSQVFF